MWAPKNRAFKRPKSCITASPGDSSTRLRRSAPQVLLANNTAHGATSLCLSPQKASGELREGWGFRLWQRRGLNVLCVQGGLRGPLQVAVTGLVEFLGPSLAVHLAWVCDTGWWVTDPGIARAFFFPGIGPGSDQGRLPGCWLLPARSGPPPSGEVSAGLRVPPLKAPCAPASAPPRVTPGLDGAACRAGPQSLVAVRRTQRHGGRPPPFAPLLQQGLWKLRQGWRGPHCSPGFHTVALPRDEPHRWPHTQLEPPWGPGAGGGRELAVGFCWEGGA